MQTYRFFRRDPADPTKGQYEDVQAEQWQWVAEYLDGTRLLQFEPSSDPLLPGTFHQMREIDQSRLKDFVMFNPATKERFVVLFPKNAKLIHYYKHTIYAAATPDEQRIRAYCFGYELPHYKMLFMIMPDNTLLMTDDPDRIIIS